MNQIDNATKLNFFKLTKFLWDRTSPLYPLRVEDSPEEEARYRGLLQAMVWVLECLDLTNEFNVWRWR